MTSAGFASVGRGSGPRPSGASPIAMLAGSGTSAAVLAAAALSAGAAGVGQASGAHFVAWSAQGLVGGGVLVATVWVVGIGRPSSSAGLSLVSLAWLLPRLSTWTSVSPRAQVVLLSTPPLAVAGAALLAAGWTRRSRPPRLAWLATILATAASTVVVLGYDPFFDPDCPFSCTASPAPLAGVISVQVAVAVAALLTLAAALAALAVAVRCAGPAVLRAGAAGTAAMVAAAAIDRWLSWTNGQPPASADRLEALATASAAAAATAALVHASAVQRRVRRVVEQLAAPGLPGRPGGVVRAVHFAMPASDHWVDSTGQDVPESACRRCAVLVNADGPSVHLGMRRWEKSDHVSAAVTPATRLGLENARLLAVGRARLADLRTSQRRIVEVADGERRRIERDLHDGAQQPLVAVRMHLSSARARSAGRTPDGGVQAAEAHVGAALAALRELSHDSLGSGLVAEGLVAAIEDLLSATLVRIGLRAQIDEDHFSTAVLMTAYLAIAEGCKNLAAFSGCTDAEVTLREDQDGLSLEVLDNGRGGTVIGRGLTEIADRVGALSGQLSVDSPLGGGTRLTVRLPCES